NDNAAEYSLIMNASETSGTNMLTPLVSGAAVLVKQKHPGFTPAQVKSALVNAANSKAITANDLGDPVDMRSIGSGLLDAGAAVHATVASDPATSSFGSVTNPAATQQVQLTNAGPSSVPLPA